MIDWRGINCDGTWNGTSIVEKSGSEIISLKWSVPTDLGYSGPTVANGKLPRKKAIIKNMVSECLLWGIASTPLIVDDKIILQFNGGNH